MIPGLEGSPFALEGSLVEKMIRPLIVYILLVIAFRFVGKRFLGSRTPFDFIVLLTIANVLQNAMIGGDNSVVGGIIAAGTLLGADLIADELRYRYPWFKHIVEGEPTVLIENGVPVMKNLQRERLTLDDVYRALAKENIDVTMDMPSLQRVVIESDGTLTVTRNHGSLGQLAAAAQTT
jgi:uncharacterized membrane protein YcaP (DUF421 family)